MACLCCGCFLELFLSIFFTAPFIWFTPLAFLWKHMWGHRDHEFSPFSGLIKAHVDTDFLLPILVLLPCQMCSELSKWKKMLLLQLDIVMQFYLFIFLKSEMSCSQTQTIISFLFFLKPLSITILSENILFFSTSFSLCVLEQWDILPIFSTSLLSPSNTAPSKISFHLSILWFGCMKKHFTGLFFLSFVCLFFLNISRDQT